MRVSRIFGLIGLIIGIVFLVLAWNSSHGVVDKVTSATTGRFTQQTIWYLIVGIVMFVVGGGLWVGGRPKL